MTTIKDGARKSGVSVGTVSAIFNDSLLVWEATRGKVLAAIRKLNYSPIRLARNLRKQKTNLIGVILPDLTNPFFPQVVQQIYKDAYQERYLILLMDSNENQEVGQQAFQTLFTCHEFGLTLRVGEKRVFLKRSVPVFLRNRSDKKIPLKTGILKTKLLQIQKNYIILYAN
jgi:LacI family transcriptional regulator